MKYPYLPLLLILLPFCGQTQNQLINSGAMIKVENGANLRVDNGGIANWNAGTIDNSGNIYLDADFNQGTGAVYTGSATSWLWFEGSSNESIAGDAPLDIAKLRVDNGNHLILGNDINIGNEVDLTNNGMIELGNFNLLLTSGAMMSGYDANNYIVTNGSGFLQREVGATAVDFPVGIGNYNLATLINNGVVDNFQARLEDFVQGSYPLGNVESDGIVGRTWFITEQIAGGSDVTITLQWDTANELPNFDRNFSGISRWNGTAWDRSPIWAVAASAGATSWNQTRTGITSFSPFAVEDIDLSLPIELLTFDAVRKTNTDVILRWSTASELNNKGFYVERMLDKETEFSTIGWVDGYGNSSMIQHYESTDVNAYTGISYYRLHQIDFDGTIQLSEIKAVLGSVIMSDFVLFPIPAGDYVDISLINLPKEVENAELTVMDARGRLVYSVSVQAKQQRLLRIEGMHNWPGGIYWVHIHFDNGRSLSKRFTKS